jgi:hypothetical protein
MNDNDIIISLCDYLRDNFCDSGPFTIDYAEADEEMELPAGSTAQHLEAAASDSGLVIRRKGEARASLDRTISTA